MFKFAVKPSSGEDYEVEATSQDVLEWEDRGTNRAFMQLAQNLKMKDLYELAYLASFRQELFKGTEADFRKTAKLEMIVEENPDE